MIRARLKVRGRAVTFTERSVRSVTAMGAEQPVGGQAAAAAGPGVPSAASRTTGRHRFRVTPKLTVVMLAGLTVALLAFMVVSGAVTGTVTLSRLWAAAGLLTIIVVTRGGRLGRGRSSTAQPDRLAAGWRVGVHAGVDRWRQPGDAGVRPRPPRRVVRRAAWPDTQRTVQQFDRIISRTLAYAIVTGLLVGVYAGLVLLATHVLSFHTPVAVAASTLAAAALFSPVRRRVPTHMSVWIDPSGRTSWRFP